MDPLRSGSQDFRLFQDCHIVPFLRQVHGGIATRFSSADDHHILRQRFSLPEYIETCPKI